LGFSYYFHKEKRNGITLNSLFFSKPYMGDAILIQPKGEFLEKLQKKPYMPLGLLQISSGIHEDYKVKIIDQRIDKNWKKHLLKELNQNPICAGMTVTTGKQIKNALEISKFIKENSNVPIVWGGVHPTLEPYTTIENKYVDFVIEGEGETTFKDLVHALDKNKSLDNINGLWYKEKNKIKKGPKRRLIDLNKASLLPYHLVDINNYIREKKFLLETSRGCPNNCIFCNSNFLNNRCWRPKNTIKVIEEIKYIHNNFKNIRLIELVDSNFFVGYKKAKTILKEIKKLDLKLWIPGTEIKTLKNFIRDNNLRLLEGSCCYLGLGVESGSDRILRHIKKNLTVKQVIDFNKNLKNHDITLNYNFMSGFPNEAEEDLKMTTNLMLRLIKENRNALAGPVNPVQLTPKTEILETAVRCGLKRPEKLEDWIEFDVSLKNKLDNLPWLTNKRKRLLKRFYCESLFLNDQRSYVDSEVIQRLLQVGKFAFMDTIQLGLFQHKK